MLTVSMREGADTSGDYFAEMEIVQQDKIGVEFGTNGVFTASNGVKLKSETIVKLNEAIKTVFVWGSDITARKTILFTRSRSLLNEIIQAIKEYNNSYSPRGDFVTWTDVN